MNTNEQPEPRDAYLVHLAEDDTWSLVVPVRDAGWANVPVPRVVALYCAGNFSLRVEQAERAFGTYPWASLDGLAELIADAYRT